MERPRVQRQFWIICLVLALVTLGLYLPVAHHDFINFDDKGYIVENDRVQDGLTPASIAWAFTSGDASNWHPLTWISHMVDYQLYGLKNPGGHHLTNVLFHVANTVLLFIVLLRMTGAMWRSAIVAALFAWHPLHVESVAWAAERKDVLSAFFWLLTMLVYARYVERSKTGDAKAKITYGWTLFCFALGLMSKPMVVTLPCVLLLLDVWPLRRMAIFEGTNPDPSRTVKSLPQLFVEKIPFFALAAISCVITFLVQQKGGAVSSLDRITLNIRLSNVLTAYVRYLGKTAVPIHLAIYYPFQRWSTWQLLGAVIVLLALTVGAFISLRRRPFFAVGWFWFLGVLVPVIGLVQVGGQSMADRYTYLPLIGIFMAAVWGVAEFSTRWPRRPLVLGMIVTVILAACLVLTSRQLNYWKNGRTLFTHALAVTDDNPLTRDCLGVALEAEGRSDEALANYFKVFEMDPNSPKTLGLRGRVALQRGDPAEAVKYYLAAISANTNFSDAHYNLANLLARAGKYQDAADQFIAALVGKPNAADAHNNFGAVLMRLGKREEAIAQFNEALRIKPKFPEAQDQLASVLLSLGREEDAQFHYAEAVRLNPDFVHARLKLGLLLAQHGQLSQAAGHFQAIVKLEPTNSTAIYNLAATYAAANQSADAEKYFTQVVRLRPEDADARARLGAVLSEEGKLEAAVTAFGDALELDANNVPAMQGLAWILATAPKPELRDGAKAVRLAEQATSLTKRQFPAALAALDAAYAEAGRFDDAIKTAAETQSVAMAKNRRDIADQAARRLELYKTEKPFRQ